MIVSGPPEPPKERGPAVGLRAAPYTGGDVRKSGELGKMFDIPAADPGGTSRPVSKSHSGPLARSAPSSGSGPVPRKTSGPLPQIPPTGLITSGPARSSGGQTEQSPRPARKNKGEAYGGAVTAPEEEAFAFGVSRVWRWVLVGVFVAGLAAGAFVWVVVGRPEILIGVAALMAAVGVLAVWNWSMGRKEVERFWRCYANTSIDSRNLPIGKFVKITGVNFYISDPDTGTRFLVRAGNGARVASFVKPATVMEINKDNKELSPDFLSWLTEHNISSGSHIMRLKEG
ncbi:hypothetical protein GW17_00001902 [Ensete ventricosum]|nr:hypothetical protein GW17_00001902 [Ensete ventricosum]